MNYTDFLKSKVVVAPKSGFTIDRGRLNLALKGHQKDAVQWAIAGGRRALFRELWTGQNGAGDRVLSSGGQARARERKRERESADRVAAGRETGV